MQDAGKNREELLAEISALRERVRELELSLSKAEAAREELRSEREQLLSIFDSINEVIYIADPTTYEVIFVNEAAKRQLGRDPTGGICYREFQGMDAPCDFCTNPILLAEPDRPYYWEHHNLMLERYYLIVDRLIRWPDGRDVRFELAVDVTESRRLQRRRESLNRLLASLGPDLMDNIENLVKGAREIIGCSYAAFCLLVRDRLSKLSTGAGEEGLLVTEEKESYLSYRYISSGSREPWLLSDLREYPASLADPVVSRQSYRSGLFCPVLVEGEVRGCLTLFDHEPRAWTEEETELAGTIAHALSMENQRLHREEDLKDFIDVASHELRHPVTVIEGYVASLRKHWEVLGDEQREELMQAVERGVDRLTRLVSELLDISRIERGRFVIKKRPTDVRAVVTEAVQEMRRRGFGNHFELRLSREETVLEADTDRLLEVLLILLENAVSFSPPRSVVEIEAREDGKALLFSIHDRGVGIPEGEKEKVFRRFYQVEDALHHSIPGMGMGLYIAREIVEKHGGRIWNESREGGGTSFFFTLPLSPAEESDGARVGYET